MTTEKAATPLTSGDGTCYCAVTFELQQRPGGAEIALLRVRNAGDPSNLIRVMPAEGSGASHRASKLD